MYTRACTCKHVHQKTILLHVQTISQTLMSCRVCVHTRICTYIHTYILRCLYAFTHVHTYIHTYMCVCTSVEDFVSRPDHISNADISAICLEAGMQAVRKNRCFDVCFVDYIPYTKHMHHGHDTPPPPAWGLVCRPCVGTCALLFAL